MNLLLYIIVIPVIIFCTSIFLGRKYGIKGPIWLVAVACLLFATSTFYPSPIIDGQRTQSMTHLLGGGVMVGLLWIYAMPLMHSLSWLYRGVLLYAAVSALGVLNELYELFAHEYGIITVPISDTSWDLLANTLGAAIVFVGYYMIIFLNTRHKK